MNPLASELNAILEGSIALEMLSDYGKRIYFPKGIISQSAEAKERAHSYNATIGIATEGGQAMFIPTIKEKFCDALASDELFAYSPTAGELTLRKLWLTEMVKKNPSMQGKETSLPVVTSGLTHALSLVASLFIEKGQSLIVPDMYWGNYNLIFTEWREASLVQFPLFKEEALNLNGLAQAIDSVDSEIVPLVLNFPNNPAGYSPTYQEALQLVALLKAKAAGGKKLLVLTDDAYYGLFFEDDVCTESLFALLCDAHENILAIKGDAATKEEMVWGFRVGFLTFNSLGMSAAQYDALVKKVMGAIRGNISSCSKAAQSILIKALNDARHQAEKEAGVKRIAERYKLLKRVLSNHIGNPLLKPLPFNSGYFMAFECSGDAEQLRLHLLDKYGIGTISIKNKYLRLAFSSVDLHQIEALAEALYKAAEEVFA